MAPSKEQQRIEESLELQEIDTDLFKSNKLWKFARGSGAFGGNIIAQAAHAATKTVQEGFHLHSLHCYFISFGDVSIPTGIIYLVDRLRDGKSYVTRSVKAVQRSRCIFTLLVSFHRSEINQPDLHTKIDLTSVPPPEDCQSTETKLQTYLNDNRSCLSPKMLNYLEREIEENKWNAIEHRNTRSERYNKNSTYEKSQAYWFRSRTKIRPDPSYQKLVLAYASDFRFIGTASKAMGLGFSRESQPSMIASLDHSMFFYDNDFDVSEWMLYKMDTETGKDGRGLVIGRIYALDGRLLAVCTQEGVVRVDVKADQRAHKL